MRVSYELALSVLEMHPEDFWRLTPAQTSDLLLAYQKRQNAKAHREAWTLWMHTRHRVDEADRDNYTPLHIFRTMPGTYQHLVEGIKEEPLSSKQKAEADRRRNLKRVTRR